ncbi:MAG: hypothetical protein Q8T09_11890 [Candidatus Melainabacteria bacterium]|nr:hypothetical protein [Candidatus Melainabacteria bacterium]
MKIKSVITQLVVFLLPILAALYNTFELPDFTRSIIWDSAHYVLSGKLLSTWLSELSQGHYVNPHDCEMGYSLLFDGMIMPSFAALLVRIGSIFQSGPESAYTSVILGQCVLAGLNSLLIFRISRRLGFSRTLSCAGGLAWGLYPGQVIGASRFMSEPLAATLSLIFVLLLSSLLPRSKSAESRALTVKDLLKALGAGISLVLLTHTKAVMAPVAMIILGLTLLNLRPMYRAMTLVGVFATGAFITVTPWLMFTQATMNHRTLLPERMPGFNISIGLDRDVDGWAPYPKTEYVNLVEHDKPNITIANAFRDNPLELSALFARKVERLFRNSWNDFYYNSLGLAKPAQVLIHQLLLLGGGLGAVYLLVMERILRTNIRQLSGNDLIKISSLLMVASSLIFVLFEAQSRYAFPAMAWVMVLTIIGLDHLEHTWHSRALGASCVLAMLFVVINRIELAPLLVKPLGSIEAATTCVNLALALSFAVWLTACCRAAEAKRVGGKLLPGGYFSYIILSAAFLVSFAFLHLKEQYAAPLEWYCQLGPGQTIERRFRIPQLIAQNFPKDRHQDLQTNENWAAIIVDGNPDIENSTIKINGLELKSKPELLIPAVDKEIKEPSESAVVYEAARAAAVPLSQLRQWRFVRVPLAAVHFDGDAENTLSLTTSEKSEGALVFGQYRLKAQEKQQMTPALWGFSLGKWSTDGDMRVTDKTVLRVTHSQCKPPAKNHSSSSPQFKDNQDLSPAAGEQSGEYRLYLVLGRKGPKNSLAKVNSDLKPELNMQFKQSLKIIL